LVRFGPESLVPFAPEYRFMSDEYRLTFRQSDHARPDFAAIESNLQFIVAQLARLPDRAYVSRLMVLATVIRAHRRRRAALVVDDKFGIGHGFTAASDALILKMILSHDF